MRDSRYLLSALVALTLFAVVGCGDETSTAENTTSPSAPSATEAASAPEPKPKTPTVEGCLEKPDTLENIEKRDATFWRAYFEGSAMLTRVEKFDSQKDAARAVREATDVWAEKGGNYAVFGPFKDADPPAPGDSEDLVPDTIKIVADCLKETK